jgi:hypothetical protein
VAATGLLTPLAVAPEPTAPRNRASSPYASEAIAGEWPGDYYWMFLAMVLMVLPVGLVAAVHGQDARSRA